MKKLVITILFIISLGALVGCQVVTENTKTLGPSIVNEESKPTKTLEEFRTLMESKGFNVEDITLQYDSEITKGALMASNDNFKIIFFDLISSEVAMASFQSTQNEFNNAAGSFSSTNSFEGISYEMFSMKSNKRYMLVSRIKNTLLYVDAMDKFKDEIVPIYMELGY